MSGIRFDLTLADGRRLEGVRVQGDGGELGCDVLHLLGTAKEERALASALGRMQLCVELAAKGRRFPLYEPIHGHVTVFGGHFNDSTREDVSLVGATVDLHDPPHERAKRGRSC